MFENVDGRTDAAVTGILIAHLGAFGSGELKIQAIYEAFECCKSPIPRHYPLLISLKCSAKSFFMS